MRELAQALVPTGVAGVAAAGARPEVAADKDNPGKAKTDGPHSMRVRAVGF